MLEVKKLPLPPSSIPRQEIRHSDVLKYREFQKITRSLRRKFGDRWMEAIPEELDSFLLKMHQLGTLIWMAEHPHHEPPLVVIIPDPEPEKGPKTEFDAMLKKLALS